MAEPVDPFALDLDLDVVTSADFRRLHAMVAADDVGTLGVVVARAERHLLTDIEGRRYVDASPGGPPFGHRHPRLLAAAHRQLDQCVSAGADVLDHVGPALARDLAALLGLARVSLHASGTDALASALSTAQRSAVDGPVAVVSAPDLSTGGPFGAEQIASARAVQAAGGVVVADERISGLGRCGAASSIVSAGVAPDIVVLGESLAGGFGSNGAVVGRAGLTWAPSGGQARDLVAQAVAHDVVRMLATGDFGRRASTLGARLAAGLAPLVDDGLAQVHCAGVLATLTPPRGTAETIRQDLVQHGVIVGSGPVGVLVVALPLTVAEAVIDQVTMVIVRAFRDVVGRLGRTALER